ncbi:MAG TPA: 4Fe-4S dicluster domain-containing protein, partial [Firmicutes bacterium]|nr:4Fe-4S dicluster domain-containing protein [Bacillota bacterium]
MKKPKLRELKEAITSLFSKPYTTKFPFEPHKPSKRFRGKPKFDEEKCVGCGACAQVCPSNAIEVKDIIEEKKRILIHHPDKCIYCGQCEINCITDGGIKLTDQFD